MFSFSTRSIRIKRLTCLLVLIASIALLIVHVNTAKAAQICNNGGSITMGKYWLNSNLWGASSGSGSQCISDVSNNGSSIAWSTTWNWTGTSNAVKSYDSSVLGWQWGWKIGNTGLPVQLSSNTPVQTSWTFNLNQTTPGGLDVSYDTWLSPNANLGNATPSDEVMVWLYHTGGVGPVGTKQATVTIDGTSWDLYEGNIGWEVHSFVRTTNTTSQSLNLMDFYQYLVTRGLSSSKYLLSVQSGTEIFTGAGTLNTTSYYTNVGGSSPAPTPTPTSGHYYKIVNRNSGEALDISGASKANGGVAIQWPYSGGANQQWQEVSVNGGYKLINRNSGLLLDVPAWSKSTGVQLDQWSDGNGANQWWNLVSAGNGYYYIVNQNSGLYVDVSSASTANGAAVIQWSSTGGTNQQWSLVQVS